MALFVVFSNEYPQDSDEWIMVRAPNQREALRVANTWAPTGHSFVSAKPVRAHGGPNGVIATGNCYGTDINDPTAF